MAIFLTPEMTLGDIGRLLGLTPLYDGKFSDFLTLKSLCTT
jgi:hypothetical protein